MGLIADKVMSQLVIDEMIKIFGEDRIANPEHQPKIFEYQFNLAKWMIKLNNNTMPVRKENFDLNIQSE